MITIGKRIEIVDCIDDKSTRTQVKLDGNSIGCIQNISLIWDSKRDANIKECSIIGLTTTFDPNLDEFAKELSLNGFWVEILYPKFDYRVEYFKNSEHQIIKEERACSAKYIQQKLERI